MGHQCEDQTAFGSRTRAAQARACSKGALEGFLMDKSVPVLAAAGTQQHPFMSH